MKLAAIDVGSNAVRLLISNVFEVGEWLPLVRKADLYRVPVRLGDDAFLRGVISEEKVVDFIDTMAAFKKLMGVCRVRDYLACATSALRTANNGEAIAERVRHEAGIYLRIIDGAEEARYIAMNRLDGRYRKGRYLFVDVGGGSTELTLFEDGFELGSASFNIGTLRLKEGLVAEKHWKEMRRWVRSHCRKKRKIRAIGSGGNINRIFKMTRMHQDNPLSLKRLKEIHADLATLSLEGRMVQVGLRPDRADVIVPAGRIFISVMEWAGIKKILVPQIGLGDGLVHTLYLKHRDGPF
jgi:exopolyphosphatase / guanosine-5'-triphosphate,3'-diphosphate pyrophosphatase